MKNGEFLKWLSDRLINVYGESENTDFVQKTEAIARYFQNVYPDQDSQPHDEY